MHLGQYDAIILPNWNLIFYVTTVLKSCSTVESINQIGNYRSDFKTPSLVILKQNKQDFIELSIKDELHVLSSQMTQPNCKQLFHIN